MHRNAQTHFKLNSNVNNIMAGKTNVGGAVGKVCSETTRLIAFGIIECTMRLLVLPTKHWLLV